MPSQDYIKYDKRFHEDQVKYDVETLNPVFSLFYP